MPNGILRDVHQHRVTRSQRRFDPARLIGFQAGGVPVDFTGIKDGVTPLTDVNERGLHRGQDVLDLTDVNIAGDRSVFVTGNIVFNQHVVFEDGDLHAATARAHHRRAVYGFAAG